MNIEQNLTEYAIAFHAEHAGKGTNSVFSPLAAFLLKQEVLGDSDHPAAVDMRGDVTPDDVQALAAAVRELEDVTLDNRAWINPDVLARSERFREWRATNTNFDVTDAVPTTTELDAWVQEASHGMLNKFGRDIHPDMFVSLFASVLYAKLTWRHPFMVEPTDMSSRYRSMLFSDKYDLSFRQAPDGGVLAYYRVDAKASQTLTVVYALQDGYSEAEMMEHAYREFDYPLMNPEDVKSDRVTVYWRDGGKGGVVNEVHLPSWDVESSVELTDFGGFSDFFDGVQVDASQKARARMTSEGFEAAALTSVMMMRASLTPPPSRTLVVNLVMENEFAFVNRVNGLPVFSGFVREADETAS